MVARAVTPEHEESGAPQLPRFYAGRALLITGATGFMGKVLVERLLSTCPDVGRLHLLLRAKRDVCPDKRLLQLRQSPVFDAVRARCPAQLDKLCAVPGDATLPDLGITHDYWEQLSEVSVVIHSAASIRFDEPLRQAVNTNVRSVLRAMDVADRLPNIQAFVHVSTAYSNTEQTTVEERVYPAPVPLEDLLALVDVVPEHLLDKVTDEYIAPKPNTYTFTKAVAENAVLQRSQTPDCRYPVAIFRPSIVISSARAPFPGWSDHLGGPTALLVSFSAGLLHAARARGGARCALLPVDLAVDCLLAAAWDVATDRPQELRVYNCTSSENSTTWDQFRACMLRNAREWPLDDVISYPYVFYFENRFVYKVMETLLQTMPLYIAEYCARLLKTKTKASLSAASHRLQLLSQAFSFFTLQEWSFAGDGVRRLRTRLARTDGHIYHLDVNDIDWEKYYIQYVKGSRRYILKEKEENIPEAKRRMDRLRIIHYSTMCLLTVLFFKLIMVMYNILV